MHVRIPVKRDFLSSKKNQSLTIAKVSSCKILKTPICTRIYILSRNFELLKSDAETKELFDNSRVLSAYRRETNLRDSLVSSNLQSGANTEDEPNGTFPCRRPRCKTCAHTNPASQIDTRGGPLTPGGGGLGYFLGGYVPPGTPNWHPVLKKNSP